MFEKFSQIGVVPPLPFRLPGDFQFLVFANQISMNILKVKGISSIFWDVLHVAIDIVDGLATVGIIFAELLTIDHFKVGLHCWVNVYPYINKTVHLLNMILPQSRILGFFFPKGSFAFF